jgi:nitrogen fixation/metabolism regulation signal transduction histidine kinase
MKFNRYCLSIVFRVILITLNCFVLVWFYSQTSRPATTLFFLLLVVLQTVSLILYLNRINRDLANFLIYLQENNTSLVFPRNRVEKNFRNIMSGLNDISEKIHNAQISREEKHQYLKAVIEHVDTGIFSFNSKNEVELVNRAALDILNTQKLTNLDNLNPDLAAKLKYPDKENFLVKTESKGKQMNLSVKLKSVRIGDELIKIVSLQNIKAELEEQELESWKKLIRVLRHEIMNSITPITTLATAIKRCFSKNNIPKPLNEITVGNINDALMSVEVIEERSKGLISFVEKFKSITDVPKPIIMNFRVLPMLEKVRLLFVDLCKEKETELTIEAVDPDFTVSADEQLIQQVIINLVKNSIEAINHNGIITLRAFRNNAHKVCIQVVDNGKGIAPEDLENVLVPSFSTKEDGMGIGLSISKQIIQLHHGEISVRSLPGKETVLEIVI